MRELTLPDDPMLRVRLPKVVQEQIHEAAKGNKRKPQDELMKRLLLTYKKEFIFHGVQEHYLEQLKEIYQL